MKEIRDKLEDILQELEIREQNCRTEIQKAPEGRLYKGRSHGRNYYYHALEDDHGGFASPKRKTIREDADLTKALAHKRFLEQMQGHLRDDIRLIRRTMERMGDHDAAAIIQELPRAYNDLPQGHFLAQSTGMRRTQKPDQRPALQPAIQPLQKHEDGWVEADSGILIPKALIRAADRGTLTDSQKEEIREIQNEWASQEYEINTKNPEQKNKMTSRGELLRSMAEVSIAERLYLRDIPFRYDEVIRVGNREVSPDFSFLSITRGVIRWEHCGMTHSESYVNYHRYKRGIYEQIGLVPWENYIETYNEEDGFLDIRMIDAIIDNTLLRWLHLD